jgi:hypothetical protein
MSDTTSRELVKLIAKRFISRTDVKARQSSSGEYHPVINLDESYVPWQKGDLESHLSSAATYGHYVLGKDDTCKLFCFDVDLAAASTECEYLLPTKPCPLESPDMEVEEWTRSFEACDPRHVWQQRSHPARAWIKCQLRSVAGRLARAAHDEMKLKVAVAYSGSKGVHVYCFFDEPVSGERARDGATLLLEALGDWKLIKGRNTYGHSDPDPYSGFPNLTVEVFPKQTSLEGKHLGNLLRIPLGRNLKSKDPTFFVDLRAPYSQLIPCDPVWALTTDDPWR